MKKNISVYFVVIICFFVSNSVSAQTPINIRVQISKAEDELRFDKTIENLMKNADASIRTRAALAAGRIGVEEAVPILVNLLVNDKDAKVRAASAFALGEIESIKAADAILKILQNTKDADQVRARAVEAAGKIAAANLKDEKSKDLGKAILDVLQLENNRGKQQSRDVVLLGITAILRAKPEEGETVAAKFLTNTDARIRADAANTLSRLRAKNANEQLRAILLSDDDAIVRANAARALGAAEDKDAFNLLLESAVSDEDLRVRVSAIRSLGSLKDKQAADKLLERGGKLLAAYKKSKFANPVEKNELLEIATTLGRILINTNYEKAVNFLTGLDETEKYKSAEVEIGLARVSPKKFQKLQREKNSDLIKDWRTLSAAVQGAGEFANLENTAENEDIKKDAIEQLYYILANGLEPKDSKEFVKAEMFPAIPDTLRAYAAFKTDNLSLILRDYLKHQDIFVRAASAALLAETNPSKENVLALEGAFSNSMISDKSYNDAQLAILDALAKQGKDNFLGTALYSFDAPDFLVRHKTFEIMNSLGFDKDLQNKPLQTRITPIKPYNPRTGTKLGQILNRNADYIRAVSRKSASAIITTEKGIFTIEFFPEAAPLTVDNFIKLAKSGYFNNVAIHRVVPNFVVQDGDPRGDGNGGPGWSIRDEINMLPYERGTVGMALSGKNTGGSQWFVTHSPQPHLDGGYTVFGRVNESGMKIVDNIVRGDKILNVKIVEGNLPLKSMKDSKK